MASFSASFSSVPPASPEFLDKGFAFISIGNDLHHVLTQAGAHVRAIEAIKPAKGEPWQRRPSALL